MIKINLLPARKPKRQAEPGMRPLVIGLGSLAGAAIATFLVVHLPKSSDLSNLRALNDDLQKEIDAKNKQLLGYKELQAAHDQAEARVASIDRLTSAKVVPANVLHELGLILTPTKHPTMSKEMMAKTIGANADPNKRFAEDWDPNHVWLISFVDTAGAFKMEGGARSESDVIQLTLRLQASVYFLEISPASGERVADAHTGGQYYKFTVTGKVAY
jgi:Tfp pilus assembly protein PilN